MRWPSVAVIIPTYNEANNIRDLLNELLSLFDRERIEGKILVVDDGSPDGTADIVREISALDKRVILLNRGAKMGLGTAYRDGFKLILEEVKGSEIIVTMDADGSHTPSIIPRMLGKINEGYDVVIASRYISGGRWAAGRVRKIISRIANILARLSTGIKARDTTSGLRAYRVSTLSRIPLENIEKGYVFQVQILYRLKLIGAKITEIPFTFLSRRKGKSKLSINDMFIFFKWCLRTLYRRFFSKGVELDNV